MAEFLNKISMNVKRLREKPVTWKTAAVFPVFKEEDRRQVENYPPISLLNIVDKIFKKYIQQSLYEHYAKFLTRRQHGFAKERSVATNLPVSLKQIHDAMDKEASCEIIVFYTDFPNAFHKVPQLGLLRKLS